MIPKSIGIKKERLDYIDNLRVFACFLVILTHSSMPSVVPEKEGFWLYGLSFLGSPSSELFLTLSGTVLLPVRIDTGEFFRRRFAKLLPPLVIWSVLGTLLYVALHYLTWDKALGIILRIPLQPAIGVYWFVYAIAGLYLFAPFISPWLEKATKRQIELFLIFWSANMIMPWILYFFPTLTNFRPNDGSYYWTLCYFGGFLGYWLLGYYLRKYPIRISLNFKWIILIVTCVAYPLSLLILRLRGEGTSILLGNLQIGSAVFVAFLYTIFQNIRLNHMIQSLLTKFAKYSFCIYLTHIYIARELYWKIFDGSTIHIFPRTFIIAVLTLITGYILTYILSKLPYSHYITGAKK